MQINMNSKYVDQLLITKRTKSHWFIRLLNELILNGAYFHGWNYNINQFNKEINKTYFINPGYGEHGEYVEINIDKGNILNVELKNLYNLKKEGGS